MSHYSVLSSHAAQPGIPISLVAVDDYENWLQDQNILSQNWLSSTGFKAEPGQWSLIPAEDGRPSRVLFLYVALDTWTLGRLPKALPAGIYRIEADLEAEQLFQLSLGWGLGSYSFDRYKKPESKQPELARLLCEDASLRERIESVVNAVFLVRDLVNTPAQDMMPQDLSFVARELAHQFGAEFNEVVDDDLLEENYPAIHAVGRASQHVPRLLELNWGEADAPRISLVGKGVCFDSGGLDIKPASAMRLMKKDMGGAAHALGLARMIMSKQLHVRLNVLIPAVENAISGDAFRPGDVLNSRKGISIEVDNTDAEGRLVLCDALTRAQEDEPELLIDFATLTGAARVALGTEVPALFTRDRLLAHELMDRGEAWKDRVWQLPLVDDYHSMLDSKIADVVNSTAGSFGGAIAAALFLQEFIDEEQDWLHYDLMAWNMRERPGRPEGGEAMGLLGLFDYLSSRYA
ncbi:MAG: leucyl aminopeptidase family protein [Gammaproteobacteria bacterium]|nr:leucyl aminopeptidase family protein [Gammaproteobacteria bacterium]